MVLYTSVRQIMVDVTKTDTSQTQTLEKRRGISKVVVLVQLPPPLPLSFQLGLLVRDVLKSSNGERMPMVLSRRVSQVHMKQTLMFM